MSDKRRILVVEDEDSIALGLKFNFEQEGYDPLVERDGPRALKHFQLEEPDIDLVVLDLMLPGMSGYEICRAIREKDSQVPILVLSARNLSEDRAHAFDCGVDQYMSKPFALPELLSRVRNLLERNSRLGGGMATPAQLADLAKAEPFKFHEVTINFRAFEVSNGPNVSRLTTMEMQLLRYFILHEGAVLSRSQILRDVWGQGVGVATRTIDNFVLRLRKYIESDPAVPRHLLSIRGTGYRFLAEPDRAGDEPSARV